jgi:hypothetical protein
MGGHVVLDIAPRSIDRAAWAEAFEETRRLLDAHPAGLFGYGFRVVAGVRVAVFTRAVVQGGDDPAERRWCLVGDRATLWRGERQRLYRDLGRYAAQVSRDPVPEDAEEDVLFGAANMLPGPSRCPPPGTVRVFGEGEQSEPCRLALLAAAMVVETRFPRQALVSGTFDRIQAEAARRWAKGVLSCTLALPVRLDAFRLVERVGARRDGEALVRAVDRLLLAETGPREAALLGVFGRRAEPWFAEKLQEHPVEAEETRRLLSAYLTATDDRARLRHLACTDGRGPRWPPETFAGALTALGETRGGGDAAISRRGAELQPSGAERLASVASPGELDEAERGRLERLAVSVKEAGPISTGAARRTVAGLLARGGSTLTEDAWDWIDREEDPSICSFLVGLAALDPADADQADLRRALLENRALCRYAAGVRAE